MMKPSILLLTLLLIGYPKKNVGLLLRMKTSTSPPSSSQPSTSTTKWGNNNMFSRRSYLKMRKGSTPTRTTAAMTKRPYNREWAGAESMFSTASTMRKNHMSRIKGAWKNKPWKKVRLLRRRRQRRLLQQESQNNNTIDISEIDLWGVEKARQNLSLPSWACRGDVEEERRLAAMKIILENDLKEVQSKTIVLPSKNNNNNDHSPTGHTNTQKRRVVDLFPDVYSDLRLLRFLRKDKIQDPVTAGLRYREFLKWRNQHDIDSIRLMVESKPFDPPKHLARVADLLPGMFRAEPSHNGTVPVLLQVGSWDSTTITNWIRNSNGNNSDNNNNNNNNAKETLTLQSFLQYWIYIFESIHKHLYDESIKNQEMIYIDEVCDLKGMDLSQFSPAFISTVMKPWLRLTQSNYPETAKRIIFLNPPNILYVVWRLVTPLASPGTVAKVSLNSDFKGTGHDYYNSHYNVKKEDKEQ